MFGCFLCKLKFNTSSDVINHLKNFHRVPSIFKFICTYPQCTQQFQSIYSYKTHLKKHEAKNIPLCNTLTTQFLPTDMFPNRDDYNASTETAVTSQQKIEQINICQANNEDIRFRASSSNSVNENNFYIENDLIAFILSLHSQYNFSRKNVNIQNLTQTSITAPISNFITNSILPYTENSVIHDKLERLSTFLKDPFKTIKSEYKFFKHISSIGIYSHPKCFTINNTLTEVVINNTPTIDDNVVQGCIVDVRFQFKKYFECDGVLEKTLDNIKQIKTCQKLCNFINASTWRDKCSNNHNCSKILLPYYLYFDDFEINDTLSSHAGVQKLCGIYCCFPTIPQYQLSKLSNILVLGFIKSIDMHTFGNKQCLNKFTEDLKVLEQEGIILNPEKDNTIRIYFKLGLVLGDNLALNDILGFNVSFSSTFFCRICKRSKIQTQSDVQQMNTFLRDKNNYIIDSLIEDASKTGIKEPSIFNTIPSFHVTENVSFDIMHDLFNGVCNYNLAHVLNNFIYKKKYFTLEILNYRKQMFNYGPTQIGNVSSPIRQNSIKTHNFKMTASEMKCFVHFILLMIGDLIPLEDEVYEFLNLFVQIIDIILQIHFTEADLAKLDSLIQKHHRMYVTLFTDHLKPKHHFMVHYTYVIRKSGTLRHQWCFCFEALHQNHKCYARNISSRLNIPLTLTIKTQLDFANRILNKNFFASEVAYKISTTVDLGNGKYDLFRVQIDLSSSEGLNEVMYKGSKYKKGYVIFDSTEEQPNVYEIFEIIVNKDVCYFLCFHWEVVEYLPHYLAYKIATNSTCAVIKRLNDICNVPTHFFFLPTGERIVRLAGISSN
ncbi:uncharacterized protein [Onthophagus taurus]|uniref:uncharacterized protein n=1 Tax=Onthophagus taurus TaxID=166361 RepID=UPI0039BE5822